MGKRKKSHRIYALVVILLGIAIIMTALFLLFYVQKIEVSGNEYCSTQEIVDVIHQDKYNYNSLYMLWKYRFRDYKKPGCVESMQVGIKNPWTVTIHIKEKKIVGFLYDDEGYVYFDKEGMVVLKSTQYIEGIPCIEGIEIGNARLYSKIDSVDNALFEAILTVTQEVKKYELTPDRIMCDASGVNLYFGGVRAALGTNITNEKMAQIGPIAEKLEGRTGTLHLEHYQGSGATVTFTSEEPAADTGDENVQIDANQ